VQGALLVKESAYGAIALFMFIAPPSMAELEARLRGRGTETEEKILQRLGNARAEMDKSKEAGFADHVVVNALLDQVRLRSGFWFLALVSDVLCEEDLGHC
jgi:guanylate kinase